VGSGATNAKERRTLFMSRDAPLMAGQVAFRNVKTKKGTIVLDCKQDGTEVKLDNKPFDSSICQRTG